MATVMLGVLAGFAVLGGFGLGRLLAQGLVLAVDGLTAPADDKGYND